MCVTMTWRAEMCHSATKLLPKTVRSKKEESFTARKVFSAALCCALNEKMPPSPDKNTATTASVLRSIATARLVVTSVVASCFCHKQQEADWFLNTTTD